MKIAKEFTWEMGHRLPFHKGKCKNLHGHTYKLILELEGNIDKNGMLIDFYDLKQFVNPILETLDHAFMVYKEDKKLIALLKQMKSKHVVVDFHSTAENISTYLLNKIAGKSLPDSITRITAKVYETPDSYAEGTLYINDGEIPY